MKKLLALLLLLMLVACAAAAEGSDEVHIQVLLTSDIHGAVIDSAYGSGDAETIQGTSMARLATLIKERRAENPNTILIDDGDTLQGTPLTYYYAFYRSDIVNPAMKAMRLLGYDVWTLGNHEFNYGQEILNKQIEDISAPATEGEKSVAVLAANFVAAGADDFTPWKQAYTVLEFDGVKVGIIGMDTPNIPNWDKPENWAGIDFKTFLYTWEHYASILKEQEGCDLVILSCHSGAGVSHGELVEAADLGEAMNGQGLYYDTSYENEIAAVIENTTGIDMVLGGHTHEAGSYTVTNKDGKEIPVFHCGTKCRYLGVADIAYNKTTGEAVITYENVDAKEVAPDPEFTAAMMDYETNVWNSYLNEVIGTASADFVSPGNMLEGNAFLDLVNTVELKATGAQMGISSPLNSNDGAVIPAGEIKLGQMFTLYVYENWLYNINMTGAEIKEWMEFSATHYEILEDGTVKGGGLYCDSLSGEGVSYDIYLGNEAGDRIRNLCYQGQPIEMDQTYQVAINNYRFTGGGHYIENVSTMSPADTSRVNYSTQFDMEQGEDLGQVRNLLTQYIRDQGTIDPVVTTVVHVYTTASED